MVDGIATGLALLLSSLSNLFLHPISTLGGVQLAIEHWEITQDILLGEWDFYRRAFSTDTAAFTEISLTVAVCAAASALLAQWLEAGAVWASRWRPRRGGISRWISLAEFGRRTGILRRVQILLRARNIRLEQRLAARGTGLRGNLRQLKWTAQDIIQGLRLGLTQPLSWFLYLLCRVTDRISTFTKASLRILWRQIAYLLLPVVLIFQPWIEWSVDFNTSSAVTQRRLAPAVESYLEQVASFSIDELEKRTEMLQTMYAEFRKRLLEPVTELDRVLEQQLNTLDGLVAGRQLPGPTIDLRVNAMFDRYGKRRLFLGELLFWHSMDDEHGPAAPSRNWLQSYIDERVLLSKAAERVQSSEAKSYLTAAIDVLDRRLAFETCIANYNLTELLARPLPEEHKYCGTLHAPASVDEMLRDLFAPEEARW
jgi:hypothetical protein